MNEILTRLARIEQALREMGHCDTCSLAHEKGVVDCIENGLVRVERSLDRLIGDMQGSTARLEAAATPTPSPTPSPRKPWWRRPIEW